MSHTEQLNLLKKEHLSILKELFYALKGIEHCDPHFSNRRRIIEVEAKMTQLLGLAPEAGNEAE